MLSLRNIRLLRAGVSVLVGVMLLRSLILAMLLFGRCFASST